MEKKLSDEKIRELFHKFKEVVENFFEKEVKEESCKADLRSFIGTSFQVIKGEVWVHLNLIEYISLGI